MLLFYVLDIQHLDFFMLFNSLSASLKTLQTPLCGESSVRLEMTKPLPAVLESLKNEWRLSLKKAVLLAFISWKVGISQIHGSIRQCQFANRTSRHRYTEWLLQPPASELVWLTSLNLQGNHTDTHKHKHRTHTHTHTQGLNAGQLYLWGHCVLCVNNRVPFHLSDGVEIQKSVNAAYSTHIHTHKVVPCEHAPRNRNFLPF